LPHTGGAGTNPRCIVNRAVEDENIVQFADAPSRRSTCTIVLLVQDRERRTLCFKQSRLPRCLLLKIAAVIHNTVINSGNVTSVLTLGGKNGT